MRRQSHGEVEVTKKRARITETTYTKAEERLADPKEQLTGTREPVLVPCRGPERAQIVAAHELPGWLETAYLLRSPRNARRLVAASQRVAAGQGEVFVVGELRQRLGLATE